MVNSLEVDLDTRLYTPCVNSCNQVTDKWYYLFKDLIRCNCLDVLQTIKCYTELEGFCHFAYLEAWIPPPAKAASLPGQGRFARTAVPQQPCTQSSSPAGSSLLAHLQHRGCSHGRDVPLATLSAFHGPCCPESLPALAWEELQPSLNSAGFGAQAPAEATFLLALSFLFCSLLSQVLSTDVALRKHCELVRSSSEWGVHLPAPSFSQNKPKLLGQLPQSLLPSLPLLFPSKRCSHFNIKALSNPFIPSFSSSFKLTGLKSSPALFAHLHLVVNKEKGEALLLGTKGYNFDQLPWGSCLVSASLGFPTQGRLCMWPFKLNLLHMFSGSANWTSDLTTIQWV